MKIKVPKFVLKIACKYVSKAIEEETGIRMDIEIGDMSIDTKGREYRVHMEETAYVNKQDLKRYIKDNITKKEP